MRAEIMFDVELSMQLQAKLEVDQDSGCAVILNC